MAGSIISCTRDVLKMDEHKVGEEILDEYLIAVALYPLILLMQEQLREF